MERRTEKYGPGAGQAVWPRGLVAARGRPEGVAGGVGEGVRWPPRRLLPLEEWGFMMP